MNTDTVSVSIQTAAIDIAAEYAALTAADSAAAAGAFSCFCGRVRGGEIQAMTLEHYPGMTEKALTAIAHAATRRWQLDAVRVVHRVGRLLPGEAIVFVAALSAHRQAATAACAYITDYLKTDAPFWKKEETKDGTRWVGARRADEEARRRWEEQEEAAPGSNGNNESNR